MDGIKVAKETILVDQGISNEIIRDLYVKEGNQKGGQSDVL